MPRPSEPVLAWLRTMITKRGLNTAALAAATGHDRNEVRKALSGSEPMTLDLLMALSNALNLSPSDMGLAAPSEPPKALQTPAQGEAPDEAPGSPEAEGPEPFLPDPWGNHAEQLFRMGFALGCDFFFVADTSALGDSGVPRATLESSGKNLSIALDARFHVHNAPRYDERGVTLTLSFDALYDCTFPWESIRQVMFFPAPPERVNRPVQPGGPSAGAGQTKAGPARGERGHLRLVTDE